MYISKIVIQNFKKFQNLNFIFNPDINIIVGENDSGKTTILEALYMTLTGKINGSQIGSKITVDWFNQEVRNKFKLNIERKDYNTLPKIEIEVFFDGLNDDDIMFQNYRGTNNSLREDGIGIKLSIVFDDLYGETYKQLLKDKKIFDIPIELYKVEYSTFASKDYYIRNTSKLVALIDSTKKDYSEVLNRFVSNSLSNFLSESEETELSIAYRSNRMNFVKSAAINNLNKKLQNQNEISNVTLSLNLREEEVDGWKKEMTISINDIPFENNGFGTQNIIKSEMLANQNSDVNFLILEEPENNLSFSNMSLLISSLSNIKTKQLFISTHSSYVANKLNLNNLLLVNNSQVKNFKDLSKETYNYFAKLPGYNTLRLLLANKIILVEGPADELILQRAYLDNYEKLPLEDGIDVLSVGGLAFMRYCELAYLINKEIKIVTDNDYAYQKVIEKYKVYTSNGTVKLFVEENNILNTLEPSVLEVNKEKFNKFKKIVYEKSDDINYDELLQFMKNNKTEWALRVFQAEEKIKYPKYILEAIGIDKNE